MPKQMQTERWKPSWYNPANNINPDAKINRYSMIDDRYKYIREKGCKAMPIYVGDTDANEQAYEALKCFEGRGYVGIRVMERIPSCPLFLFVTEDIERFLAAGRVDRNKVLWFECSNHRFVRQNVFNDLIANYGYTQYTTDAFFSNRFLLNSFLHTRDVCDIGAIIEYTIEAMHCQVPNPKSHTILE